LTTWLVSTVVVAAAVSAMMSICNPPTLGSPKTKKNPQLLLLDNEMQIESSFSHAPCCHVMPSCSLHVHWS
jgi:hypothetical protein